MFLSFRYGSTCIFKQHSVKSFLCLEISQVLLSLGLSGRQFYYSSLIFPVFVECLDRTVRGAAQPGAPLDVIMTPSRPRPSEAELVSYYQYYLSTLMGILTMCM